MSFIYNGISSDAMGVVVERMPNRNVPSRRIAQQEVAGRNGNVLLIDNSFPNVEQTYEVYFAGATEGLPTVARRVSEWLCSPTDYCVLSDSYDTSVFRNAILQDGYDIENSLNKWGKASITFSCKPQKFLTAGTSSTTSTTLTNPTPFEARPLITVTGSGAITIGGKTITVLESVSNFKIDCETMEADDNTKIYCLDFPVLTAGTNTVTKATTITSFSIIPRWWTL